MPTQVNLGHVVGPTGPTGPTGPAPIKGTDYWTEEEQSAIVEEAAQEAAALVNGNVPKKTVTDLVVHGEDAYAQKSIEVRVKGKTWVNRWPVSNGNKNGITVSTDETGLITISGTNDTGDTVYFGFGEPKGLAEGKQVTFTSTDYGETGKWRFVLSNIGGSGAPTQKETFRVAKQSDGQVSIVITNGTTIDVKVRVMLVDGTEAPDCFTPCASIASVQTGNLVTAGKNLLPKLHLNNSELVGITATLNDDNSITLNGTATGRATFVLLGAAPFTDVLGEFVPGTYTLSVGSEAAGIIFEFLDWREQKSILAVNTTYSSSNTETLSNITEYTYIRIQITDGTTLNNVTIYPQLELGSTATAYEPPNVTETALPEVELRNLPNGTCDELVIKADGTCEVERRAATVLLDGTQPIVAELRGNGRYRFRYYPSDASNNLTKSYPLMSDRLAGSTAPIINNDVEYCVSQYTSGIILISLGDEQSAEEANAWFAQNPTTVVYFADETTEPQSPVTLPALPAPTFNQYHDSAVPSDTSTQYARDINIVLANLEAVQAALLGGE